MRGHARPLAIRRWRGGVGGDLGTQPRTATRFAATALGVPQPAPRRADPARCRRHLHRIPSRRCPAAAGPNSGPGSGTVWVTEFGRRSEAGAGGRWVPPVGTPGTRRGHEGERGYWEYGAMRRCRAVGCGERTRMGAPRARCPRLSHSCPRLAPSHRAAVQGWGLRGNHSLDAVSRQPCTRPSPAAQVRSLLWALHGAPTRWGSCGAPGAPELLLQQGDSPTALLGCKGMGTLGRRVLGGR